MAGERRISSTAKNRTIREHRFSQFSKVPTALIYSNFNFKNLKNISADPAGKESPFFFLLTDIMFSSKLLKT